MFRKFFIGIVFLGLTGQFILLFFSANVYQPLGLSRSTFLFEQAPLPTRSHLTTERVDWFNKTLWHDNPNTRSCVVMYNVCHTNQQFFADSQNVSFNSMFKGGSGYPQNWHLEQMDPNLQCHVSEIPNHFVLQSDYNYMLGEFYARALKGFHNILLHDQVNASLFAVSTQMYIHMQSTHYHLLDSHKTFTQPWRNSELLLFQSLLHNTNCQCLPRLILCGYEQVGWNMNDLFNRNVRLDTTKNVEVRPGGHILHDHGSGNYQSLRNNLRSSTICKNPLVTNAIQNYRVNILRKIVNSTMTSGESKEWTIVGLSDRKARRRWDNVNQTLQTCNSWLAFPHKVVCVIIYVDDTKANPYWHAVLHGALDGLIGIHGAQLTNAVWMRPGAFMVELLPYVPKTVIMGQWTRLIHRPTPLGEILQGTDLNHVGISLERSSLLDCQSAVYEKNEIALKRCYIKIPWDDRDFVIDPSIVIRSITAFGSVTAACFDWQEKLGQHHVLYNVNCHDRHNKSYVYPHSFYKT